MRKTFTHVGILGKPSNPEVQSTLTSLIEFIKSQGVKLCVESGFEPLLTQEETSVSQELLGKNCDLIIVVGGDGSFLNAARSVVDWEKPVVGINRGRLGFLADISPQAFKQYLLPILKGDYQAESRFLLEMSLIRQEKVLHQSSALNDVVLYSGDIARMIEFEVKVNDQFVYRQRSDGLVTATPTGSTAYALSGGGPILHPALNAIVLVPLNAHTLSSRPIVLDSQDKIELRVTSDNAMHPRVSCDGQIHFNVKPDDRIVIRRKTKTLTILHPKEYDYYHTLRTKLNWST